MPSHPARVFILAFAFLLGLLRPAVADMHIPTTPPSVKIESMDVYWKRPDAKYIRLTFKLWNEDTEDVKGLAVRLYVRADDKEAWRPIKTWQEQNISGHDGLVLEYQPGAITDPVLYLGRFQMKLEARLHGQVLDAKDQRYEYQ